MKRLNYLMNGLAALALIVLFALGALCGFTMAGSYADLNVWAAWCLICAVFAAVSLKKGQ